MDMKLAESQKQVWNFNLQSPTKQQVGMDLIVMVHTLVMKVHLFSLHQHILPSCLVSQACDKAMRLLMMTHSPACSAYTLLSVCDVALCRSLWRHHSQYPSHFDNISQPGTQCFVHAALCLHGGMHIFMNNNNLTLFPCPDSGFASAKGPLLFTTEGVKIGLHEGYYC